MHSFMYPTQATPENEWIRWMLEGWRDSDKSRLCFPFARFFPRQLASLVEQDEAFWMYTYYRNATKVNDFIMGGQVRIRFHVIGWSPTRFGEDDLHLVDFPHMDETIWFLCDHAAEIIGSNGEALTLKDFEHPEGKRLRWFGGNSEIIHLGIWLGLPVGGWQAKFSQLIRFGFILLSILEKIPGNFEPIPLKSEMW